MKKMNKRFSALAIAALLLVGSISVGAASAYKEVTARQNTGMQVKSGDIELTLRDDNGNTLYPLTYNNVVYLPAEQLADLLGYDTTVTTNSIRLEPKASTDDIGAGKAKAIALNHAGISASQVVFVKVDKEYDDGRLHYDVEFYSGNKEYDYEIDAITGDEMRSILEGGGKLYTQLKIDDISNLGAVKIRIRSLIAAIEARKANS